MIPIIIKDFQWSQNADWIFIVVEVKGVKAGGGTDIVTSPDYLKIHKSPFIFELFLTHLVDDQLGECTIDERWEKVSFRLKKVDCGVQWKEVEGRQLSREEKNLRRAQAVEITQQRHSKEKEEKQMRSFHRKQATVHDQIRLDAEAKERITNVKTLESQKALADLSLIPAAAVQDEDDQVGKMDIFEEQDILAEDTPPELLVNRNNRKRCEQGQGDHATAEDEYPVQVAIRPTICIPVSFTPRLFPTPSRESTHADEQEWLKKQMEARKLCGFVDEDLRPEERNPEWLLDKGLSLMRTQSYLGAISAFSLGIRLAPKMAELFAERAGAHLAVKNYHRTVEDCSQALELLTPPVAANLEHRFRCHIRRGAAFRQLDLWEEAQADYAAAILLKPENNEELISVQAEIQAALEKNRTSSCKEETKEKVKREVGETPTTGPIAQSTRRSSTSAENNDRQHEDY